MFCWLGVLYDLQFCQLRNSLSFLWIDWVNNVRSDFKNYAGRSKKKKYWMLVHIGRMMGGYTASLTAFIVVNAQYYPFEVPSLVIWLGPAVLLTPFSIYWSKPYK